MHMSVRPWWFPHIVVTCNVGPSNITKNGVWFCRCPKIGTKKVCVTGIQPEFHKPDTNWLPRLSAFPTHYCTLIQISIILYSEKKTRRDDLTNVAVTNTLAYSPINPSMPVTFSPGAQCIGLQELWIKRSVCRIRYWIYHETAWAGQSWKYRKYAGYFGSRMWLSCTTFEHFPEKHTDWHCAILFLLIYLLVISPRSVFLFF